MCQSPRVSPQQDQGSGVGGPSPRPSKQDLPSTCDASDLTEDILKRKNTELHELQAQMLSLPRGERKKMKVSVEQLDTEIKTLQASFALTSEVQRNATELNTSIASNDPDAIASARWPHQNGSGPHVHRRRGPVLSDLCW